MLKNLILGSSKSVGCGPATKLAVGDGSKLIISSIVLLHDVNGSV